MSAELRGTSSLCRQGREPERAFMSTLLQLTCGAERESSSPRFRTQTWARDSVVGAARRRGAPSSLVGFAVNQGQVVDQEGVVYSNSSKRALAAAFPPTVRRSSGAQPGTGRLEPGSGRRSQPGSGCYKSPEESQTLRAAPDRQRVRTHPQHLRRSPTLVTIRSSFQSMTLGNSLRAVRGTKEHYARGRIRINPRAASPRNERSQTSAI